MYGTKYFIRYILLLYQETQIGLGSLRERIPNLRELYIQGNQIPQSKSIRGDKVFVPPLHCNLPLS